MVARSQSLTPRDRLILALDLATPVQALRLVQTLGDSVSFYKIGMELVYGGGLELAQELVRSGKQVFLDLKLHDIPHTVTRATEQIARLGVHYLTIHAYPQTMQAARLGVGESGLRLLGVTVMTSMNNADVLEAGYALNVQALVHKRAQQARAAQIDGLILSGSDVASIRASHGNLLELITPGIRPSGAAEADQKRVMTPAQAVQAGANRLVVGRPVTQASDPKAAAEAIVREITHALDVERIA
jgi:orotidine-5'-phosphate decarboxylase